MSEPPTTPQTCSGSSLAVGESLHGTATEDTRWLFVEHDGPWPAKAVAAAPMSDLARAALQSIPDTRVQLIRRPASAHRGRGTTVFDVRLGPGTPTVTRAVVSDLEDLAHLSDLDLQPYADPLWFVCTNGRRDACCAVLGRAVTTVLSEEWPEATWETTHLGGHRWAGTVLALPSGLMLGRLTALSALAACEHVLEGHVDLQTFRGRAGLPARAQHAEIAVLQRRGVPAPDWRDVATESVTDSEVVVRDGEARLRWAVTQTAGPDVLASCRDDLLKASVSHHVELLDGPGDV